MARKPSFSQIIRDTRKKRGLSVAEVAERVGVSAPASICGRLIGVGHGTET
jgi:DNA-binding XRE family transcriptional regulator